jgi:hypothetical protein
MYFSLRTNGRTSNKAAVKDGSIWAMILSTVLSWSVGQSANARPKIVTSPKMDFFFLCAPSEAGKRKAFIPRRACRVRRVRRIDFQ